MKYSAGSMGEFVKALRDFADDEVGQAERATTRRDAATHRGSALAYSRVADMLENLEIDGKPVVST